MALNKKNIIFIVINKMETVEWICLAFIILLIIIVCVLFACKVRQNRYMNENMEFFNTLKIGLVTMTKKPVDLDIWLKYHLDKLKFEHIYLRVEETPEIKPITDKYKDRISTEFSNNTNNKNSYFVQMDRQSTFIKKAIKDCEKRGIKFLLHIDDDELFMLSSKYEDVKDLFIKLGIGKDIGNIHFNNVEAVFPKGKKHCFATNKFLDCSAGGACKSYANGKSAGQISKNLQPMGPHNFSGKTKRINKKDAMVLHFDSCNYDKWFQKFKNLSNIGNKKFNEIPFRFYKDSITFLKNCKGDSCSIDGKKLWEKNKVDPYYNDNRGVIDVPLNL